MMKFWVLERIFNQSSSPRRIDYLAIDCNFKILDKSSGVQRVADCPDQVMLGKDVRVGFPELIGSEDSLLAIMQGQQESFEIKSIVRYWEPNPLYINMYVFADEAELLSKRLIIIVEDVTERMVLEQNLVQRICEANLLTSALQESEERYRDLFENANDLIQCCATNGRFMYVNRAWRQTLGYSSVQVQQMNVFDIIHPDCKASCLEIFQRLMSGEKIEQIQAVFITKSGEKIWVEGSVNCKFVKGEPVSTRGIFRDITKRVQAQEALRYQQEQTERLLLNILPNPIAERLKQQPGIIADNFSFVTVLFADIVGFTELSTRISPTKLVEMLNVIFSEFDKLAERHGLEKIKTIGDAYMVVGGLPIEQPDHASKVAQMALDMQQAINQFNTEQGEKLSIRIGIDTGSVVAGVIGLKKFAYDLWGDTVNTASRMESHGLAGKIQVTAATYEQLRDRYLFEERGVIQVKGKGEMNTYLLISQLPILDSSNKVTISTSIF